MQAQREHSDSEEDGFTSFLTRSELALLGHFPMPPTDVPVRTDPPPTTAEPEVRRNIPSVEYPGSITAAIDSLLSDEMFSQSPTSTKRLSEQRPETPAGLTGARFSSLGRARGKQTLRPIVKNPPPVLPHEQLVKAKTKNDLANYLKTADPPASASEPIALAPKEEKPKKLGFLSLRGRRGHQRNTSDAGSLLSTATRYIDTFSATSLKLSGQPPYLKIQKKQTDENKPNSNSSQAPVAVQKTTSTGQRYWQIQIPCDENAATSPQNLSFNIGGNRHLSIAVEDRSNDARFAAYLRRGVEQGLFPPSTLQSSGAGPSSPSRPVRAEEDAQFELFSAGGNRFPRADLERRRGVYGHESYDAGPAGSYEMGGALPAENDEENEDDGESVLREFGGEFEDGEDDLEMRIGQLSLQSRGELAARVVELKDDNDRLVEALGMLMGVPGGDSRTVLEYFEAYRQSVGGQEEEE